MRRPVRPFVTEYRGGSRRPSSPGQGLDVDIFKAEPSPNVTGSWPPQAPSQPDLQEDGYDAALRAADALFAGHRTAPSVQPAADGDAPKPGSPTGGRVLRVLDEAPSPEMLEMERLEAEHAPKKRGRKPGSKNKPKIAALEMTPPPAIAPAAPAIEAPALPAATVAAALVARAIATAPRRTEPAVPGERFAWVRTRLKPGQQWKRRLPKVAW